MIKHLLVGSLAALAACGGGGNSNSGDDTGTDGGTDGSGSNHDAGTDSGPPAGVIAVPLVGEEIVYAGPLTIGGQSFTAVYDTGSSTVAVAGSTCTSCGVNPTYAPGSSATDQHQTASSTYGDGSGWRGEIYQDMMALGGAANVAVKFASITTNMSFFRDIGLDYEGIVGLGPDAALLSGTSGYMTAVGATGVTKEFAFQLCPTDGTFWVGGYDASKTASTPQFTPIVPIVGNQVLYHAVDISSASVGGTDLGVTAAQFGPTIIDTGTSVSFVPSAVLTKLTTAINNSANYSQVFSSPLQAVSNGQPHCLSTSKTAAQIDAALPPLAFTFAGTSTAVSIPATQSYLFTEGGGMWCYGFGDSSQVFGGAISASLLGDVTLHGVIAIFDLQNQKIGFAPQVGCDAAARETLASGPLHTPHLRLPPRTLH